jgi:hypothetical protein
MNAEEKELAENKIIYLTESINRIKEAREILAEVMDYEVTNIMGKLKDKVEEYEDEIREIKEENNF